MERIFCGFHNNSFVIFLFIESENSGSEVFPILTILNFYESWHSVTDIAEAIPFQITLDYCEVVFEKVMDPSVQIT